MRHYSYLSPRVLSYLSLRLLLLSWDLQSYHCQQTQVNILLIAVFKLDSLVYSSNANDSSSVVALGVLVSVLLILLIVSIIVNIWLIIWYIRTSAATTYYSLLVLKLCLLNMQGKYNNMFTLLDHKHCTSWQTWCCWYCNASLRTIWSSQY